ncbi:Gfo/Idh/MocA family oxidoreductase [Agromyces sp. SYSU K20354]|uniref:Gfo/Idh/MocA family protein n=1 Tax=Agromyces cavernae TaxID=2898659 RepID=UPI001E3FCC0D|nr:Gfo/Idh/MocA family oxidoreductase [Agromyces cavernae]MCD2441338.1 Gfo/Idh/MocA family oxidoreductase [Agromyces cavernae]
MSREGGSNGSNGRSPERIGIGLIGMGNIAIMHLRALSELRPHVDVVAYSGGTVERATDALAETGWAHTVRRSPSELLLDPAVDVVVVCAPSGHHGELTIRALEAGKHVVVEKPMATSLHEARAIVRLAELTGLAVSVISQRRFEPEYQHLKRLLDAGELGRVLIASAHVHWYRDAGYYEAAAWRNSMSAGGGSLMNQGVHSVDLMQWLCGPAATVTAQLGNLARVMDAEDTTVATVGFESGALGMISTSTATRPGDPATISIHLSSGVVELGQGAVLRWDVDAAPPKSAGSIASGASDPLMIGHTGHLRQWGDIVRAIDESRPPTIDSVEGLRTVRLVNGIYEAARSRRQVDLGRL